MNIFKILVTLAALLLLSGCAAPVLLFGGAAGAGTTLAKEKTIGSSIDDTNIWAKIKAAFTAHRKELPDVLSDVSVEVSEGRVLLTGTVASADERLEILKLVWQQAGVREVINELKIREGEKELGISQYTSDTWITTQVKSKMLMDKNIHSINYNVETIDGVVYVLGVAVTQEESDLVKTTIENIKNVTKCVSYIRVKGQQQTKELDQVEVSEPNDEAQVIEKGEPVHSEKKLEINSEHEPEQETANFDEEIEVHNEEVPIVKKTPKKKPVVDDEMEIEYSDSE